MKMKLAGPLNDKVLAADADMNKADWFTGLATIAGVTGIGLGLWWADSLIDALEGLAGRENWVEDSSVRVRDMGHVFHAEVFVVQKDGHNPTMVQIEDLAARCRNLDWKVYDTIVAPVPQLPEGLVSAGE